MPNAPVKLLFYKYVPQEKGRLSLMEIIFSSKSYKFKEKFNYSEANSVHILSL